MEDLSKLENLEEYFKKVNCYGEYNYCFTTNSMINNMFGAIGALISIKKNKNVMGYLLNKNDKGICLIPIIAETINKNKIDIDNYIFIKEEEIDRVTIKNEEIGFKKIIILLKDKTKYVLKTPKKVIKREYHKVNLDKFIEFYK